MSNDTLDAEQKIVVPICTSVKVKKLLITKLKEYRSSICHVEQHGLLFGIEIATVIPDCIINNISNNAHQCSVDLFLQHGLSHHHSLAIHSIVTKIMSI